MATEERTWGLAEGDEIAPGRSVLRLLGGGNDYEVYLVWDDKLFAVMVAKLLRPDLAEEERSLRSLRREAEALEALAEHVRRGRLERIALERFDGEPIVGSPVEALLVELGFRQGPRKLTLTA